MLEIYLCGIWDPYCKYIIIKETNQIIDNELHTKFPDLPKNYLPKVKFRILEDDSMTEVNIQNFYNTDSHLEFLGSVGIGDEMFDLYYRESFDPRFDYVFLARYGNDFEEYYSGSKTAEAEYYMGLATPLSIAYGMAVDDGII
jgi:hypothetical protein